MNPIYITGQTPSGVPLLGGMFQMHDREGFPIDACLLEAEVRNAEIDWLECLADAYIGGVQKWDALNKSIKHIDGYSLIYKLFVAELSIRMNAQGQCEDPIKQACLSILSEKRNGTNPPVEIHA